MISTATTALSARLGAVHAHQRVTDTLLGVVLDVLEPFACDYLSRADYSRLCEVARAPVGAATEAALATITRELQLLLEADPRLAARLDRTPLHLHAAAD
jgi:hypothetical protein